MVRGAIIIIICPLYDFKLHVGQILHNSRIQIVTGKLKKKDEKHKKYERHWFNSFFHVIETIKDYIYYV